MNVLKQGSKLLSVGLMGLSLSAGFSGLALAQTTDPEVTVTPNPVVLENSPSASVASMNGFSLVAVGTHLQPGAKYTVITNLGTGCATVAPSGGQVANTNGRVTFDIVSTNATTCTPGTYTVGLASSTAGAPVPLSTTVTVLSPRDDAPAPATAPITGATAPITRFPRQFNGATPRQLGEANGSSQVGLANPSASQISQHSVRTNPPASQISQRSARTSQRSTRTSPPTSAASQNSDALLRDLTKGVV
jgi:hypothetical protein